MHLMREYDMQIKHLDVLLHMRLETDNLILHFDSYEEVSLTVDKSTFTYTRTELTFSRCNGNLVDGLRKSCHPT